MDQSATAGSTPPRVRILHAHSTFSLGGKEARAVRLMNAFGDRAVHSVLSAMPDELGARDAIDPAIAVDYPTDAPSLQGRPGFARYHALARYFTRFDLVLTYNWGAMDAVMAHRIFGLAHRLPPLIHHEDGFNADEAARLRRDRSLFRRVALGGAHALVVPSETLAVIARDVWRAGDRLHVIANGIATGRYAQPVPGDALPGMIRNDGDIVVGTLAGLRAVKDLPLLVRAVAAADAPLQLVIVGEGPERARIAEQARACGIADRVHLVGFHADPARVVGAFDVFALSSRSEQMPISVIEAMAAGLPIAAPRVGDVAAMLAPDNAAMLVAPGDQAGLAALIARLARDPALCAALGDANRARAAERFDEATMIARYAALYGDAIGDPMRLTALI